MRVYEIAKEVGIPNKDLIAKIRALGLEVNNHMSSLDADDVARIKRSLEKEKHQVAAPAETKKLTSTGGAVLRRRSADKPADEGKADEAPRAAAPAAPVPAAVPPVIRRRVAEEAPAPAPHAVETRRAPEQAVETRRPSEPAIQRPAPSARQSEPAIERP